jgi:hypothetical protein
LHLISAFLNANQALIMALPSQEELRSLIADLNSVAKGYSTAPDLNGYMSRVEIITKAKKLTQALITPEQLPNYHGLNVSIFNWQYVCG